MKYWVWGWLVVMAGLTAQAGDGWIQISPQDFSGNSYVISNSGSYVFTAVTTNTANTNGIVVMADNVTINLNGFTFAGRLPVALYDRNAIYQAPGYKGLVIQNGFIERWGTVNPGGEVFRLEGSQVRLEDLTFRNNGGLVVMAGLEVEVRHCIFADNANGAMRLGTKGVVSECMLMNNGGVGIEGTDHVDIERTMISGHSNGVAILVHSNCVVQNNFVLNSATGIVIQAEVLAAGNYIGNNHVVSNLVGIQANGTGSNLVIRNTAMANSTADFDLAAPVTYGEIWATNGILWTNNPHLNISMK